MKTNWQTKKLSEVCEIKPQKSEARKKLKDNDLVSFVPMEDLGIFTKEFIVKKERKLKDVSGSYTYFANDDVLLAKITPCFENGKLGIAHDLKNGIGFGSSEFVVFRSGKDMVPDYLYYILSAEEFRGNGKKVMSGAVGHKRVPKEYVENFEVLLPPISDQKRIAKTLDDVFEKLAKAKENAEKNLQNSKELFESYLQSVFANPGKDWEEKSLEELGQITSSKRIYKKEYTKVGIPFYRIKEIKELANDREISIELFISKDRYKEIKDSFGVPAVGDILMTAVGTIGEIYVVENKNEFYFKDGNVLWFKNFKSVDPYFLKYVLISFVEQIKKLSKGSAYSALTIEKIEKHKIFIPKSLAEQKSIVKKLDALSTETKKLEKIYEQKLADLEELKKSVLKKAFAGEL